MRYGLVLVLAMGVAACGADDPTEKDITVVDAQVTGTACLVLPDYSENLSTCEPANTDYQPRQGGQTNGWPACISDDNVYHQIQPSISSISRVEAYDTIGDMLWRGAVPTHEDFLAARVLFEEEQGLGSRVARRYDPHYTPVGGVDCSADASVDPDYCVGPATLQPIIADAFADGATGNDRIVNAAKIQAAVQWFMYVSANKEATSCTQKAKDCDSAWAYYNGGTERASPIGLAADIHDLGEETHERVYDGVLAVRCWRDLDSAEEASNVTLRDQAIAQMDRALVRGMGLIVRQHFAALACATGDYRKAHIAALEILVPLLDRETRVRDSATADLLVSELAKDPDVMDLAAVTAAIDATYPCP